MKTITGKVLSTTRISLSKAASILSKFVSADTGASQAVCAYLRRSSASFNELSQLHKELKSHGKRKTPRSDVILEEEENPTRSGLSSQPEMSRDPPSLGDGVENERNKHKKKKEEGQIVEVVEVKEEVQIVEVRERKKHKKNKEEDRGENFNLTENGGVIVMEEEKVKKKRKSVEIEDEKENHVEEVQRKRKKKRKTEE